MKSEFENKGGFGWAAATIGLYVLPLFFFSPYELLATRDAAGRWDAVLSPAQARVLHVFQWSAVIVIFAWFARKVRFGLLLPLSLATIALTIVATVLVVRLLGMNFYWDLWH
jgi:hypothetical protein